MNHSEIIQKVLGPCEVSRVDEGISNLNYKASFENRALDSFFITLFLHPSDWWKIAKDQRVKQVMKEIGVPYVDSMRKGTVKNDETGFYVAYLVQKFMTGMDLDVFFRSQPPLPQEQFDALAGELGTNLAKIHEVKLEDFGLIKGLAISGAMEHSLPGQSTWKEFLDQDMKDLSIKISVTPQEKKIGEVTKNDLVHAFNLTSRLYSKLRPIIETVVFPHFTHNDTRFANFLVDERKDSPLWELTAVIDYEWALAGDPEIDLVQIENWLQFTKYKEQFMAAKDSFLAAYTQRRPISPEFQVKRRLYHAHRSLTYLTTVFNLPPEFEVTELTEHNTRKHLQLLFDAVNNKIEGLLE